jgi:hypothetical protein
MSKSLLAQATHRIKAMTASNANKREESKTELQLAGGGLGSIALSAGAGWLDKKHGKDGEPHKVLGIPTVGIVGLAIAAPAIVIPKFPARTAVAMMGISLVSTAAYRYTLDHTEAT